MTLALRSHGMSDIGRQRARNEDQFVIAELRRALTVQQSSMAQPETIFGDASSHLLVVADGMGGHRGGEQASAIAVLTVEQFMLNTLQWFFALRGDQPLAALQEALKRADARIFAASANHPELKGMGTTLTMGFADGSSLYVVHAGDSRCYLFRGGTLHQITRDHTLTEQLVREGAISASEAESSPFRNVITNAVGGNDPGVSVEVQKLTLAAGDTALFCSDGLSGMVSDGDIAAILARADGPEAACRALVDAANGAGGRDNITAIVARFDEVASA